jgi:hypothetical protein
MPLPAPASDPFATLTRGVASCIRRAMPDNEGEFVAALLVIEGGER